MSSSVAVVEPFISVVIPTYNYGYLLHRALCSVIAQQTADVEVLVINDGSTDETEEIFARFQRSTGCDVHMISQPNRGVAAARNRGVRAARGRYVFFLDADDELLPEGLAALRQALISQPDAGMVLGAYLSVNAAGAERLRLPTQVVGEASERIRRYLLEKKIAVSHSRSLFRRDLLLQRPYPEELRSSEDVAVFACLLASATVVTTDTPVARIHKHADSLRHRRADQFFARQLVAEVFASLPSDCQRYRQRYEAQRYLSLFRAAARRGDQHSAAGLYRQALRLWPFQALRLCYLNTLVRVNFGWR